MGRVLTVSLLVLLAVLPAVSPSSKTPPQILLRSGDDPASRDAISDLLENIRKIIREGSEDPKLPVLDPFQLESQELNLNELGAYDVKAGIRNVVATGLGDFVATMSTNYRVLLARVIVTVDISVPLIAARGQYGLESLLGEVVRLYGNGNLKLDITNLNATIVSEISLGVFSSTLRSLTTTISVGDFQFALDGLMEGGPVDQIFNLAVNEVAKIIYQSQKANVEDYVSDLLREPVSEAVKDIGMQDLLCLIGLCGSGGGGGGNGEESSPDNGEESSPASGDDNGNDGDDNGNVNGGDNGVDTYHIVHNHGHKKNKVIKRTLEAGRGIGKHQSNNKLKA